MSFVERKSVFGVCQQAKFKQDTETYCRTLNNVAIVLPIKYLQRLNKQYSCINLNDLS